MDLAKNIATWRDRSPDHWLAVANRHLPPLAVGLLVLLIALKMADLTWRLLDSPVVDAELPPLASAPGDPTPARSDYDALTGWAPFGVAPTDSAAPIEASTILDAPDTTLSLVLKGIVQAQELPERGSVVIPERGFAIIESGRGEQKVYASGDAIENVGNATLHSVFSDRALLDRGGGRLEALRYRETASIPRTASRITTRPTTGQRPTAGPNASIATGDAIGETAQLLGQHMQIAMQTDAGQIIGYRVQPRGDGQVFAQLGLEPGDILTEVNGVRLNNLSNTTQVLQTLGETQQATVMVRRNNADQALVLNINQLAQLANSLR